MGRTPDFLVHDSTDVVGVVVVEDVEAEKELEGWVMTTDETVSIKARDGIPLGHKIALVDIAPGDTIMKYGHDIGEATAQIGIGGHVHVHNVKTKRW